AGRRRCIRRAARALRPSRLRPVALRCGAPPLAYNAAMTPSSASWLAALRNGLHVPWTTVLLIFAINTGVAGVMWIEDTRPFWHPFVSTQCFGFSIAYCVAVAAPWNKRWPVARLIGAVAVGAIIGMLLVIVVKRYTPAFIASDLRLFGLTMVTAFFNGVFVSLFFLLK